MTRRLTLVVVALAVVVSACGPVQRDEEPRTHLVDATVRSAIPMMKEGRDYRVTGIYGPFDHGFGFVGHGSVRKGVEFGVLGPHQMDQKSESGGWSAVATVELDHGRIPPLDSGKVKILKHPDAPEREGQVSSLARSGDQLVWLTDAGNGQCLGCDWVLYAADLKTSRVRRLASHRQVDDPGPTTSLGEPQIVDGRVYLTVSHPSGLAQRPSAVYRVPLDRGDTLRKVIPGASAVFADGRHVRFVNREGQLLRWDPMSRKVSRSGVSAVRSPKGAFFHEGVAVQGDGKRLVITEVGRGKTVVKLRSDVYGYLNATSRWVGFTITHASLIYDLKRRKLLRMKGASASPTQPYNGNRLDYNTTRFDRVDKLGSTIELMPR